MVRSSHKVLNIFVFHFFMFGIFCSCHVLGQEQEQSITKQDTSRLVSYADKIIIKVNVDTQTDAFTLIDNRDQNDFTITPNSNYRLFLSLDYQFLGASIGFAPTFFTDNQDEFLKGESSFENYQFRFFLGQWVQGIYYKKIKGYYVENTQDYIPDWEEGVDPYIQFSNLKNYRWGMSTSYVFNKNFSYRNVTYQTEWQKKSAGSFIPSLYYDYNKFSFSIEDVYSEEENFNARLALVYHYTYVFKEHWFLSANLGPSIGFRYSEETTKDNSTTLNDYHTYFTRFLEGGLQLGYSSKRVIVGCRFHFNSNWYNQDRNVSVSNDSFYGLAYIGYRFNTPKFIDKAYKWSMNLVGLDAD